MATLNLIEHDDAVSFLKRQPSASVDAIITDGPYLSTNLPLERRRPVDWKAWWVEAWRVVKPAGVIIHFCDWRFGMRLMADAGQYFCYEIVWEKSRATSWLRANRAPMKAHEFALLFCRESSASTFNRQNVLVKGRNSFKRKQGSRSEHYSKHRSGNYVDDGTRAPMSVQYFPSLNPQDCLNPCQKPLDLLRWLVLTYTNPGDRVADCFIGSGTTADACAIEGRDFIGCDDDPEQVAEANKRVQARYQTQAAAPLLFQ